jgi:hypothetical protein
VIAWEAELVHTDFSTRRRVLGSVVRVQPDGSRGRPCSSATSAGCQLKRQLGVSVEAAHLRVDRSRRRPPKRARLNEGRTVVLLHSHFRKYREPLYGRRDRTLQCSMTVQPQCRRAGGGPLSAPRSAARRAASTSKIGHGGGSGGSVTISIAKLSSKRPGKGLAVASANSTFG